MPINDNGDIVRAVGFVAINGAYLENRIAELVETVQEAIDLKENISFLSASDQARHLLKSLNKVFERVPEYPTKERDIQQVKITLAKVKKNLKARHEVIHSILISKSGGVIQKNRRSKSNKQVKSKEIVDLANDLFELQSQINGLKFSLDRLLRALLTS